MSGLKGQTVATTYEGLIKTIDSTPISTTPVALSDGDGNLLPMEVSTTGIDWSGNQDFSAATVTGITGITGAQGATGAQGDAGLPGVEGAQGAQGVEGAQGDIGLTGAQGDIGLTGAQGLEGAQGIEGAKGDIGLTGAQGDIGLTGAQGADGISGGASYYFNETQTSDVLGYKVLTTVVDTATTQILPIETTGLTPKLVQQFITPQLGFAAIPGGSQRFNLHYLLAAAGNNIDTFVTIQLFDSTGTTPIGSPITTNTSQIGWIDSVTPVEVAVDLTLPTTSIDPTWRMAVYIYVVEQTAGSHTINFYTQGTQYYSFANTTVGVVGNKGATGAQGSAGAQGATGAQGVTGAQGTTGMPSGLSITDLTPSTPVTGFTTVETTVQTILIPANSVTPGNVYNLNWRLGSTKTVSGTTTFRMYLGTTPGNSGLNLFATQYALATTSTQAAFSRQFFVNSATSTAIILTTSGQDWISSSLNVPTYNIDWTVDQYFTVTATLSNATNTAFTYGYSFYQPNGSIGAQGSAGVAGAQGPSGGEKGATGAQGDIGLTGAQGAQGDIGLTGAQGVAGTDGAQGATGAQGNSGTSPIVLTIGESSLVTGPSTVDGILSNALFIPANTFTVGDLITIKAVAFTPTGATTGTIYSSLWVGPTATFGGSSVAIGDGTTYSGSVKASFWFKNIYVQSSTQSLIYFESDTPLTDTGNDGRSIYAPELRSINWAVDNYVFISYFIDGTGDTYKSAYINVTK